MNPRDVLSAVVDDWLGTGTVEMTDQLLVALVAAGFVIVRKPADRNGVFVRWDTTPCPTCEWFSKRDESRPLVCHTCGGSGVVTAVTMHGLEALSGTPMCVTHAEFIHPDAYAPPSANCDITPVYRLAAINTEAAT